MTDSPLLTNEAAVTVVVGQQDLVAAISGSSFRQIGRDDAFTVDGSVSYDPDEESASMVYTWTCAATSASAECTGFALTGTSTLSASAESLPIGTYTFTLTVSKPSRVSAPATVSIEIVPGAPPGISLTALPGKYNVDDETVSVTASTTSTIGVSTTVWSVDAASDVANVYVGQGTGAVGDVFAQGSVSITTVATISNRATVGVSLTALTPGYTYTLMLTATDNDGFASYSTVDLVMNEAPSSGSLVVSPKNGFALATNFKFMAIEWDDADLPLGYVFGTAGVLPVAGTSQYTVDTTALSPFGEKRLDSILTDVTLSLGPSASNFTLGCFAEAVDTFGARGLGTSTVSCFELSPRFHTQASSLSCFLLSF